MNSVKIKKIVAVIVIIMLSCFMRINTFAMKRTYDSRVDFKVINSVSSNTLSDIGNEDSTTSKLIKFIKDNKGLKKQSPYKIKYERFCLDSNSLLPNTSAFVSYDDFTELVDRMCDDSFEEDQANEKDLLIKTVEIMKRNIKQLKDMVYQVYYQSEQYSACRDMMKKIFEIQRINFRKLIGLGIEKEKNE